MKLYDELILPFAAAYAAKLTESELYLAQRCAITSDGMFFVRQPKGHWSQMSAIKAVRQSMVQNYLGRQQADNGTKLEITTETIDKFLKCSVPYVRGGMKIPTSTAPMIYTFDEAWINTWCPATMLPPDGRALNEPLLRMRLTGVLRMIRESICGLEGQRNLDEMIAIIHGDDPAELPFRFTMHWLAAPLQEIGTNLQTNLWHIGELNGTGKGTLSLMMASIYGFANSRVLNEDDITKGGWTDSLDGALWVGWNEIQMAKGFDANSFIKQYSTEAMLTIRKRNHHPYQVLNFANWYISGNKESAPWGALDFNDRRNAIFACTTDTSKLRLAQDVREMMTREPDKAEQVLAGFHYLLKNLKVDMALIARAPETELKREMQDAASPEQDGVYWLTNDPRYPRDTWLAGHELLQFYSQFNASDSRITPRRFTASVLSKLARKGYIERQRKYDTTPWKFRVSSEKFPASDDDTPQEAEKPNVLKFLPPPKH